MTSNERLKQHPILKIPTRETFTFYFNDRECLAAEGEVISSSLFANGIKIFGRHHADNSPMGIFCANGQCSRCLVIADGKPVKACMTPTTPGMRVYSCDGIPVLPPDDESVEEFGEIETIKTEVLVVGGGPSGISAAIELGKLGHSVILVDDRNQLGGKLVLQTHTFFGSIEDCYAGTRGIDIARILWRELEKQETVKVYLNASAIGVFADKKVGILQKNKYFLVKPEKLLIATGAREKALNFPNWHLPGVYGAGAFQTLLNRDLVKPSKRLFIIGGGNVGLIAAYHAIQAGITVVGLAEALPKVSGYKVHADKIKRLGVPIYLSHSALRVDGDSAGVKTITISRVDSSFNPIPGTEKTFSVDTVLIAVGLTPVSELFQQAEKMGMGPYRTGDAAEIAEASAAMFNGRITGLTIAADMGDEVHIPPEWYKKEEVLKSKPGAVHLRQSPELKSGVYPVFHCSEEIPCNPCTDVCPRDCIRMEGDPLLGIPVFEGECISCFKCVAFCPGLAITLVDYRNADEGFANVTVPFEILPTDLHVGDFIPCLDADGNFLLQAQIARIVSPRFADRTLLLTLKVPGDVAEKVAGVQIQDTEELQPVSVNDPDKLEKTKEEDVITCSCMRVNESLIREKIRQGVRDMNQLKAEIDVGLGSCGGKTCQELILRLFKQEGVDLDEVVPYTKRPPEMEVPLGIFAPKV